MPGRVFPCLLEPGHEDYLPAPLLGIGAIEDRLCLASGLTDSITRYSLSALLTSPETPEPGSVELDGRTGGFTPPLGEVNSPLRIHTVPLPINAASGIVEDHEDRAETVIRPREQSEVVGAEVEHEEREGERESAESASASTAALLRDSGLLPSEQSHRAAPEKAQPDQAGAGDWVFCGMRSVSPQSSQDSLFQPVAALCSCTARP